MRVKGFAAALGTLSELLLIGSWILGIPLFLISWSVVLDGWLTVINWKWRLGIYIHTTFFWAIDVKIPSLFEENNQP